MKCPHCQSEVNDEQNFCPECGEKLDAEIVESLSNQKPQKKSISVHPEDQQGSNKPGEVTQEEQSENVIKEEISEDETTQVGVEHPDVIIGHPEQPSNAPIEKKKFKLNKYILIAALACICLFLIGTAVFAAFPSNNKVKVTSVAKKNLGKKETKELKEIHMQNDQMTIFPNKTQQIDFYTYPENADTDQLKWKSSNKKVKVNQSGYVTSSEPNTEAVITVSNKDGSIKESTKVKVSSKDDAFYATLDYINNKKENDGNKLSLQKKSFPIGDRISSEKEGEKSLDFVLNTIDKEISSYNLNQKQFENSQTGNKVDVDIYSEPTTGDIQKIVTIESVTEENNLEITDYYYQNGKVLFIFKRNENYYRPYPAHLNFAGERYYFQNDTLYKWRVVKKNNDLFEKTDYTFLDNVLDWKVSEYEDADNDDTNKEKSNYTRPEDDENLRKEKKEEFLNNEKNMLDKAYNLYNKIIEAPDTTNVTGYVYDIDHNPLSGATVKVFSNKYKMLVGETKTDDDGLYSIKIPMNYEDYTIYVSGSGYVGTKIYGVDSNQQISNIFQEPVYMYNVGEGPYEIQVSLVDALSGDAINESDDEEDYDNEDSGEDVLSKDYQIIVRQGINNRDGSIVAKESLDSESGTFKLSLDPGNYTAQIIADGYVSNYFTISTLEDGMTVQSNIVKNLSDNDMRIVLSWNDTPSDLDSHLFLPNGEHIAYYSKDVPDGELDLDDTDGFGPETITLNNLQYGTYKYYVADYTNSSDENYSSTDMSDSFARVDVYTKDGLTQTFTVPRNREGVIWQAFTISNKKVIPVQRIYNNIEDYSWWQSDKD